MTEAELRVEVARLVEDHFVVRQCRRLIREKRDLQRQVDNLAQIAAKAALANSEMAGRLDWWRRMYYSNQEPKRASLRSQHRLNGES